ncbi:MAG: hypothetical protein PGN09_14205 [Sphingomonas fennica]
MAATGAAVAGDGGEAGHGCDLLGGELSEFAQVCEEGEGGDGADARNGPEDSRTPGDGGGLGDGGFDLPVEAGDVADDASAAAPERPAQPWVGGGGAAIVEGDLFGDGGGSGGGELGEVFLGGIGRCRGCR